MTSSDDSISKIFGTGSYKDKAILMWLPCTKRRHSWSQGITLFAHEWPPLHPSRGKARAIGIHWNSRRSIVLGIRVDEQTRTVELLSLKCLRGTSIPPKPLQTEDTIQSEVFARRKFLPISPPTCTLIGEILFLSCVNDYIEDMAHWWNLFHQIFLQYKGTWAWQNFLSSENFRLYGTLSNEDTDLISPEDDSISSDANMIGQIQGEVSS